MSKGLPPGGATVSPEVPDDLFQAHRSLYLYAARFAAGRRVLDLGCGTGYGAPELLGGGAASVLGIDRDPACIRYARRSLRFESSREPAHEPGSLVRFEVADPGAPAPGLGTFGLVLAFGLLPRLVDPGRTLDLIRDLLEPGGTLIVSLPPILDGQALALHQARPGQLSNLYLWDWEAELTSRFPTVRLVRHLPPPGPLPDFGNPRRSALDPASFRFEEIPLSEIYDAGNLTALFVCDV